MTFPHFSHFSDLENLYDEKQSLESGRIMSRVKKCPKCGGEMIEGEFLKNIPKVTIVPKKGRKRYDRVVPTYCKNCGFLEIYKEMKEKRN